MTREKLQQRLCSVEGCPRWGEKLELCGMHYRRLKETRNLVTWREAFILNNPPENSVGYIPLTKGRIAIVDEKWYHVLIHWKWYYGSGGYAVRRMPVTDETIFMHKVVGHTPIGFEGDHINCDKLDNREENLRDATHAQNCANQKKRKGSSRFKGVFWFKPAKLWCASITINYVPISLGYFHEEEDAAMAYNKAAIKHFGPFAKLNELP